VGSDPEDKDRLNKTIKRLIKEFYAVIKTFRRIYAASKFVII
jgi:hypothetical protein